MAYNKYKDLEKRTLSDIVLKNKAFKIDSNPRYNGYQRMLASMGFKIFDKKILNFKKRKVYSSYKDNI